MGLSGLAIETFLHFMLYQSTQINVSMHMNTFIAKELNEKKANACGFTIK